MQILLAVAYFSISFIYTYSVYFRVLSLLLENSILAGVLTLLEGLPIILFADTEIV